MKLTLEQQYKLPVLHSKYQVWWCPGDLRSQGINRHGIDAPKPEYSISINQGIWFERSLAHMVLI